MYQTKEAFNSISTTMSADDFDSSMGKSQKIVCCSYSTNKIDVYDMMTGKKRLEPFDGVGLGEGSNFFLS